MPQTSSFVIANDAGAAVRARINEVIAALQSTSAGASAPTATTAGMLWVDTSVSPPVLRRRNATNTGWDALLDAAGNLAGLANTAMARTNLGLGTMATKSAADYDTAIAAKAALSGATFTGVVTLARRALHHGWQPPDRRHRPRGRAGLARSGAGGRGRSALGRLRQYHRPSDRGRQGTGRPGGGA